MALFVVTAREGVVAHSEKAKANAEYFKAHGLQALGIETAEACAEWLHRHISEEWGALVFHHPDCAYFSAAMEESEVALA